VLIKLHVAALTLLSSVVGIIHSSNSSVSASPSFTQIVETTNFPASLTLSLLHSPPPDWERATQRYTIVSQASPRVGYEPVSLSSISAPLTGNDPKQLAIKAFATFDPIGTQQVQVTRPATNQAVVMLAFIGVGDDSVQGMKYRVELKRTGQQWKIVWAGYQVKCQPGRGHQNWSTQRCS